MPASINEHVSIGTSPQDPVDETARAGTYLDLGGAVFNVRAYELPSDTDGTAAVERAIEAASAAGGGLVEVVDLYELSSVLTVPSNITLDGLGRRGTLKITSNPGGARDSRILALDDDAESVTIRGLVLDGNGLGFATTSFAGALIACGVSSRRLRIENCHLKDAFKYFVQSATTLGTYTDDLLILDCLMDGSGMDGSSSPGIFLTNVRNTVIARNTVRNTGDDNIALVSPRKYSGGTTDAYCRDVLIVNNLCDTVKIDGSNIALTGERVAAIGNICKAAATPTGNGAIRARHSDVDPDEFLCRDFLIADNLIEAPEQAGILISGTRGRVSGNRIRSPGHAGIYVVDSAVAAASGEAEATPSEMGWLTIEGNEITGAVQSGIHLVATALQRVKIANNTAKGCAEYGVRAGGPAGSGALLDLVLEGNACSGNTLSGLRVTGRPDNLRVANNTCNANATWGIDIHSGVVAARFDLLNNTCQGNTTAPFSLASAVVPTSARGNHGLTSNVGTPAVPATGVNQTNPYGIPATLYVIGGTVTALYVDNGIITGLLPNATLRIAPGGSWKWAGSVAPTVQWVLEP